MEAVSQGRFVAAKVRLLLLSFILFSTEADFSFSPSSLSFTPLGSFLSLLVLSSETSD